MSKKRKKKSTVDPDDEEIKEDLILYFAGIPTVIIYGRTMQRIRYDGLPSKSCIHCHCQKDDLHWVACEGEICPHCKGQAINCKCDPDINNAEIDNYVECISPATGIC